MTGISARSSESPSKDVSRRISRVSNTHSGRPVRSVFTGIFERISTRSSERPYRDLPRSILEEVSSRLSERSLKDIPRSFPEGLSTTSSEIPFRDVPRCTLKGVSTGFSTSSSRDVSRRPLAGFLSKSGWNALPKTSLGAPWMAFHPDLRGTLQKRLQKHMAARASERTCSKCLHFRQVSGNLLKRCLQKCTDFALCAFVFFFLLLVILLVFSSFLLVNFTSSCFYL